MGFGHRNLDRVTINRSGGRKNKILCFLFEHNRKEIHRVAQIIAVVLLGICYRLPHTDMRGKMHHRYWFVAFKSLSQLSAVGQITFDQHTVLNGPSMTHGKVVVNHRIKTKFFRFLHRVAADIASPARNQQMRSLFQLFVPLEK